MDMRTKYTHEEILTIKEIVDLSDDMIYSIGVGNFSKTPVIYEELFLTVAQLMEGDFLN
tara:strand:- start:210 stop:386 length:177 start_codon:yes stop_codon:yes gene_type:complete